MKEKSLRENLKKILKMQKRQLSKVLSQPYTTPENLFCSLDPNYYSKLCMLLTFKQLKDLLDNLNSIEQSHFFEWISDYCLFQNVILPENEDTSLFERVSDERLKSILNDYLNGHAGWQNELFQHLCFNDKCRMIKLLNSVKLEEWLKYCFYENKTDDFFNFIKELESSDEKEQIYEKFVLVEPEVLARVFEMDTDGIFTRNILNLLTADDKADVFRRVLPELLLSIISKDNYAVMRESKALNNLIVCNLKEGDFELFFEGIKEWDALLSDYFYLVTIEDIYKHCPKQREFIIKNVFLLYDIQEIINAYYRLELLERLEMLNILLSDKEAKHMSDLAYSILEVNKYNLTNIERIVFETLK